MIHAFRYLPAVVAMLLAAGSGSARAAAGEWVSYRDAYRAMVVFAKYGEPKNFLQSHYQVMPREKGISTAGLELGLRGRTVQVNLPLDPLGRTVFPLLKAAYDENAVLVLNRKVGDYVFRPRVSITVRPDGVYDTADLRVACEQALAFERHVKAAVRSKKCVGVRFAFAAGEEPAVRLRKGDKADAPLPVAMGGAFGEEMNPTLRVVDYRFADGAGHLVTREAPLAIAPLFDPAAF